MAYIYIGTEEPGNPEVHAHASTRFAIYEFRAVLGKLGAAASTATRDDDARTRRRRRGPRRRLETLSPRRDACVHICAYKWACIICINAIHKHKIASTTYPATHTERRTLLPMGHIAGNNLCVHSVKMVQFHRLSLKAYVFYVILCTFKCIRVGLYTYTRVGFNPWIIQYLRLLSKYSVYI